MRSVQINPKPLRASFFSKYLGAVETAILVNLIGSVSPKVMIEFGCNAGITAKRVLENVSSLTRYIGIDVDPDFVTKLSCQVTEVPQRAGAYAHDDDRFFLLTSPTAKLKARDLEPCDAVFIDGDHSFAAVTHESSLAREIIRPGGIIVWHDFNNPAVEVTDALMRLHSGGWPIKCVEHSWLAFMRT